MDECWRVQRSRLVKEIQSQLAAQLSAFSLSLDGETSGRAKDHASLRRITIAQMLHPLVYHVGAQREKIFVRQVSVVITRWIWQ